MIIVDYSDGSPDPFEEAQMQSHFGPSGPVPVVHMWLGSINSGDFEAAWTLMDPSLRLCRAQAWLWNNRGTPDIAALNLDRTAEMLAGVPPAGALWASFATTELRQLHEAWQRHFEALDAETLGAASRTRAIGPDLEVVVLTNVGTTDPVTFDESTLLTDALVFTVRLIGDAWKVAAYGDHLPIRNRELSMGRSSTESCCLRRTGQRGGRTTPGRHL